jgi:hypothetical protein
MDKSNNAMYLLLFIVIGAIIAIIILGVCLYFFLQHRDLKLDYSNRKIKNYIQNTSGVDYLIVPYFIWQKGKLQEISKRYSEYCEIDGKRYKVGISYSGQAHQEWSRCWFPSWLYRDFKTVITAEIPCQTKTNINTTVISGDNNCVVIQQNEYINIKNEIDKYLCNSIDLSESATDILKLFSYKLKDETATKSDASRVLGVLTKILPFPTALISLIKAIFF